MTTIQTLSYPELQSMAKDQGIRANQGKNALIIALTELNAPVEQAYTFTKEQLESLIASSVVKALGEQKIVKHEPKQYTEHEVASIIAKNTIAVEQQNAHFRGESVADEVINSWSSIMNQPKDVKTRENAQFGTEFPVSEGQMKFVTDLYTRHRLDVTALSTMSRVQIRAEIDRLRYADLPASDKQLELIRSTVAEINEISKNPFVPAELVAKGLNLHIKETTLLKLTGGQEGTAGAIIDKLFAMRKDYNPYRPLSEKQADLLVKWFFCPDVPFEQYDINKKIGNVAMLPEQFKEELLSKLMSADASKLIDDNMSAVTEWERSRSSSQQRAYIRKLEARMADISVGSQVEWAVGDDGEVVQVQKKAKREYNPTAYDFMPEEFLIQMSKDDAEKYINQLRLELSRPKKGAIDNNSNQQDFEDKRTHMKHIDVNGKLKEQERITDFLFKLEAVVGYDNSELRDEVDELLVHGNGSMSKVTSQIQEFIDIALDMNAIKIENLVGLAQNSQVISAIIKTSYPLEYDEAINGKRDPEADNSVVFKEVAPSVKEDSEVADLLNSL
jgi:hypothetical protein